MMKGKILIVVALAIVLIIAYSAISAKELDDRRTAHLKSTGGDSQGRIDPLQQNNEEIRKEFCKSSGDYNKCMYDDVAYNNARSGAITGTLTKP
jgi:hypothetical protein